VFSPFNLEVITVRYQNADYGRAIPHRITRHTHPKARPETPEPADHDLPHVVADGVGVPFRPVQQSLHRVRAVMPGVLGQLPARLDFKVGEQAGDELGRCAPGFDPGEPACEMIEYQG